MIDGTINNCIVCQKTHYEGEGLQSLKHLLQRYRAFGTRRVICSATDGTCGVETDVGLVKGLAVGYPAGFATSARFLGPAVFICRLPSLKSQSLYRLFSSVLTDCTIHTDLHTL